MKNFFLVLRLRLVLKLPKIKIKKISFSTYNLFLAFLLSYFIFFDYKFFGIVISIFILFFGVQKNINFYEVIPLVSLTIFYFLKKLVLGIGNYPKNQWDRTFYKFYDGIFPDWVNLLKQFECNYSKFNSLINPKLSCPIIEGYGPLTYYIPSNLNYENFYRFSIGLIFLTLIVVYVVLIYKYSDSVALISILFLSPSFGLLIHQMNVDIIFMLVAVYCLYDFKKNLNFKCVLLLFISLIKLHPVGILIGMTIFTFLEKEFNVSKKYFFTTLVFLISSIFFFINQNTLLSSQRPSGFHNSTGILSISQNIWINYIQITGQYRDVLIIYIFIVVFAFLTLKFVRYDFNFFGTEEINIYEFSISTWLIINYFYANYDYRNALILLFIPVFMKGINDIKNKIFYIFLLNVPIQIELNEFYFNISIFVKLFLFFCVFLYLINPLILKSKKSLKL